MTLTPDDLAQIQAMIDDAVPSGQGFSDAITAGVALLLQAIQSPNYVPGISGWTVNKDGTAEFNNLAIRGTFNGTDYVINSSGEFFYSGTPAAGNLTGSITNAAGSDDGHGNAYLAGHTSYQPLGGIYVANNLSTANQLAWLTAPGFAGPYTEVASVTADINGNLIISGNDQIGITSPLVAILAGGAFETWHSLGGLGATGYTILQGRYRYEAIGPGYTVIQVQLQAGAGGGTAGVYTFANTLPAGYQFPGTISNSEPLGYNGTVTAGGNFGNVLIDPAGAGSPGRVRIDIPALPANTIIGATLLIPLS